MIRPRRRRAAFIAVIAVLAAGALLSMHVYTAAGAEAPVSHDMSSFAKVGEPAASVGSSDHSTGGHLAHGLVECCFWLLLTGLALFVVVRSFRLRAFAEIARTLTELRSATSQRAPPLTTRLSLVGVSRR